jgi:hypothetical protein
MPFLSVKQSQMSIPRRRAVRVMMMAVMDVRLHPNQPTAPAAPGQQHSTWASTVFSIEAITISHGTSEADLSANQTTALETAPHRSVACIAGPNPVR